MEKRKAEKNVLIVDDEMNMRFFLSTLLKKMGHHAIIAKNGADGLARIKTSEPDLVILDVMMPQMGGALVFRELKTNDKFKHIPVVMLSGVNRDAFFHYIKMVDVNTDTDISEPDYYLEKPVEPEYLEYIIDEIFQK